MSIELTTPGNIDPPDTGGETTDPALELALEKGDINRDGVTDTADLGILLSNFGWVNTGGGGGG